MGEVLPASGGVGGRTVVLALLLSGMLVCLLLLCPEPAPAAYTFSNCASCHTTYPDTHSLDNCTSCHRTYTGGDPHLDWSPAPAGDCLDAGCHTGPDPSYVHGANLENGTPWSYAPESPLSFYDGSVSSTFSRYAGPGFTQMSGGTGYRTNGVSGSTVAYSCGFCHSATYSAWGVPQHDEAQLAVLHQSNIASTSCTNCHDNSLADEAGHTSCLTCHGPSAPALTQAAVEAGYTGCQSCHPAYLAVHDSAHTSVVSPSCTLCHESSVTTIHADCSTCHNPTAPAGATCITCHPDYVNPHGAGVRTWGEEDYYTWLSVGHSGSVLGEIGANPSNPGVHGNYLANTAKCGICHSVHRARGDGVKLLNSTTTTCIGCHAVGTTVTEVTVNVGTGPHSVSTSCNGRGCHVDNPHGANGSQYKIVAAKLLSKAADTYLTDKALSNPAASGITAALLNGGPGWDEGTRSAVRTGYTCNIEGCHYQTLLAVVSKGYAEDRKGPRYDLADHRAVTGHMSVAAAVPGAASYTPVVSCVSCHDQTDSLTGNGFSTVSGFTFPHGQTPSAGSINNTGGNRAYLWYTTAGDATGSDAGYFAHPNDKAFDGACLKCHRDGVGNGIGQTH